MKDPVVHVYMDLQGAPVPVGHLYARFTRGREGATFEYTQSWLAHPERFALEPGLILGEGPHHTPAGKALFGALGDSAPDRWGRNLINRAEQRRSRAEKRTPRTLREIDYLLGVFDEVRPGALRFKNALNGPFQSEGQGGAIPPLLALQELLEASERVEEEVDTLNDLKLLLAPGSSLGGARPKASVRDSTGRLLIAKFPSTRDPIQVVQWESVALSLAAKAGIQVAQHRLVPVGRKKVLLLDRFDRRSGERVPFLSALSLLGAADNETHSYLEIAEALRQYGAAVSEDLPALWRRIVFNVLISNTDDHLRNHGFLYAGPRGWRLSPAYDLNPTPTDVHPRLLATPIPLDHDPTASLDLAFETAKDFALSPQKARDIASEVKAAVKTWRQEAARIGLKKEAINRMATAFEHT